MKSTTSPKWKLLKLGTSVPIKPGDVCSLLNSKCWFKILLVPGTMEETDHSLKRKADEVSNIEPPDKKLCSTLSTEAVISPSETLNEMLNDDNDNVKVENQGLPDKGDATPVLKDIYGASSQKEHETQAETSEVASTSKDISNVSQAVSSPKETNVNKKDKDKEIFTSGESGQIKADDSDDGNDQNEDSNDVIMEEDSPPSTNQNQIPALSPKNTNNPRRDKCAYGKACYRKNPRHKAQFSHPGDPDYTSVDERPECSYGVRCYRKNAKHNARYKHTSLKKTPRRQASKPVSLKMKEFWFDSDQSSTEESVDESDYDPSVMEESSEDSKSDSDSKSEHEDGTTG